MQHIEPEDLLTFGFIPEFIGRRPMVTVLSELTEEQLVSVLTEPKNALVKQGKSKTTVLCRGTVVCGSQRSS